MGENEVAGKFEDRTLVCMDCGRSFTFTSGEQEFYALKGFANEPKRCPDCRDRKKQARFGQDSREERQMYTATCAACGGPAEVPFMPNSDRPVYCSNCFAKIRSDGHDDNKSSHGRYSNY
ncbi:MAG: zinc-ribbon domain containing protein [Oscillospiraceae bacterium]|jgi:CxxC-x17-CxxC domain-containing protein|nr:zinc-ribbon domain containing protein [Oscillospiraceae bacterium]